MFASNVASGSGAIVATGVAIFTSIDESPADNF